MNKIIEHIKEKKKHYIITAVAGTMGITLLWLGTRINSYAISVNDQVVTIVKTKEEALAAYETLVTTIKEEKGVDIAVNEQVKIEAVHSKTNEIKTGQAVIDTIGDAVTYGVEAYEIIIDGQTHAIVESEEVALKVLAEIAKQHLSEGSEVVLDATDITELANNESSQTEKETEAVETEEKTETTEVAGAEETVTENAEETIVTEASKPLAENTQTEATILPVEENIELLQVPDALPKEEVKNEIKVGSVQVNETQETDEEPKEGQKIVRELKGFDFNEQVTLKNTYVNEEEILTEEAAVNTLLGNLEQTIEYELKEGDNIWDIAVNHGTTMEHILEINPQIVDEKKMQIGEKIKLEVPDPILSISTVEQATFKELIPAEIEYVEFSDLYKDETKVYQEGHDGVKEITVNVNKINGKEVGRELISETILKEPKIKVIAYGTKEKPKPKPTNTSQSSSSSSASGSVSSSSSGMFMHPLNGKGSVSSGYGARWGTYHRGIDIAAPAGTPIYAAASGKVVYSGYNNGGYGKMIILDHGNGYKTYYAHNSSLYVQVGQNVSKGQNIAAVGSTGNSTGNHVHFEIRKNDNPINPYNYIY